MQQRAYLFLGKLISRELAGEVFSGSKKNQQTKKQVKSQVMFFFGSISQNHHFTNYVYLSATVFAW